MNPEAARWKWIELSATIIGAAGTVVATYYTAGVYYGWDKIEAQRSAASAGVAAAQVWLIIGLGALAILCLVTAWSMIAIRHRSRHVAGHADLSGERVPAKRRNVAALELVPSDQTLSLVITPARGDTKIKMFAEISYWHTSIMSAAWSKPAKFYLGEQPLLAADVKFSHPIMGYEPTIDTWNLKILGPDGNPSGTLPSFAHGKLRLTLIFVAKEGAEERFSFLLIRSMKNGIVPPTVLTRSDFPSD